MTFTDHGSGIFTVDNFFTAQECVDWVAKSEALGYEDAKVTMGQRQVMMKAVRNNERLIYDSPSLAIDLWKSVQPYVPQETPNGVAIGLNERFRFYKYYPGQEFKRHQDGSYIRNIHEWSSYTFMIYLNEDMLGGETRFRNLIIRPTIGKALIFKHELVHEGSMVLQGVKYVLRTDVMYRRKRQGK